MTSLGDLSSFNEKMRILGTPYKCSSAYKIYGDRRQELPERSIFWETSIRYFEKYEHAKFQNNDRIGVAKT